MINKTILALSVLSLFSVSVYGKEYGFELKPWVGYTAVNMGNVNDRLKIFANKKSVDKIDNGLIYGVDALYAISHEISIGPRVEYINLNQGKISGVLNILETDYFGNPLDPMIYREELNVNVLSVPVMFGGTYKTGLNRFTLSAGLFCGVEFASIKENYKNSTTFNPPLISGIRPINDSEKFESSSIGSGFVADVTAGGSCAISKNISLGLDLSYRYSSVIDMTMMDYTLQPIYQMITKKNITADFSGFSIALIASFKF
jgi:hypothetical protein